MTNRKITKLSLETGEPVQVEPVFLEPVGYAVQDIPAGEVGEVRLTTSRDGVWAVFHWDRSAVIVFGDELSALRHAVANLMQVTWLPFGVDVIDWAIKPAGE